MYKPTVRTINALLSRAADKAKLPLERRELGKLCDKILDRATVDPDTPLLGERFLYENLLLKIKENGPNPDKEIEIRRGEYLDQIADYLGYDSFRTFEKEASQPFSERVDSCIGAWYYYARDSSGLEMALRSPVKIYRDPRSREVRFDLKGRDRSFSGNLHLRSEGLFVLLEHDGEEKELHLVFKVGLHRTPEILQGVFSGYSSYGIPVAGRAFLVKKSSKPEDVENEKMGLRKWNLTKEQEHPEPWEHFITSRLVGYEGNYIRIATDHGFNLEDIENLM